MTVAQSFANLPTLAVHLRQVLEEKKTILLYGYNGTGKTRLSMAFKEIGKQDQGDEEARDTLYFNAFTEDLFHWDNDLDGDSDRRLRLNAQSRFFAGLAELYKADQSGELYTYHFSMLRSVLEKSASFHGFSNFSACIRQQDDDPDGILHARLINILSHGNYSLFEPKQMQDENKGHFRKILHDFLNRYPFNPDLFPTAVKSASVSETEGKA